MRNVLAGILILMCVVALGAVASAENQFGIADKYKVTFSEQIRVADTLLPKGSYEIRHEMQGTDHIMVFHQLGAKNPVELRAKCQLVPLGAKAGSTQQLYAINDQNVRVLHELVFKGDRAKHVF